jgi:hypothetical protein
LRHHDRIARRERVDEGRFPRPVPEAGKMTTGRSSGRRA